MDVPTWNYTQHLISALPMQSFPPFLRLEELCTALKEV